MTAALVTPTHAEAMSTVTNLRILDRTPITAPILAIDAPVAAPPANDHILPTLHAGVPT